MQSLAFYGTLLKVFSFCLMKKINFKKVLNGRNAIFSLFILAAVFLFGPLALANTWAGAIIGGIIAVIINGVAKILILLVSVLMNVAAYSDFIHADAVSKGWVVVRDICNMFFVVILLVIAFATILGQEEYGAKKMLPKLIMAAVLINFSKMLCGLMIDVASVIMLTFVNAFSAIGAANILNILGIDQITAVAETTDSSTSFAMVVGAYIFGLLYVIIATVVVAAMLGMLVMRIVMIWILVVLSPLAFFLQAVPGKGQQYASQWWSKWSSNLIVGPVIAFFLWLSFAALQTGNNPITVQNDENVNTEKADPAGIGSKAGTTSQMAKFVIAIGMLLGGMKIAQEVGGEAGGALGAGMGQLNKGKALAFGAGAAVGKWGKSLPGKGKDYALGGLAQNKYLQNKLGELGGREGGGAFLYRGLATKAKMGLESIDKKKREKAKEYVGGISDTRILSRIANSKGRTPQGREESGAARNKMGYHEEKGVMKFDVNTMSKDDISKIGGRQLSDIGQKMSAAGVKVAAGSEFEDYLTKNSTAQRAYNEGVIESAKAYDIKNAAGVPYDGADYLIRGIDKRTGAQNDTIGFTGYNYQDYVGARVGGIGGATAIPGDPGSRQYNRPTGKEYKYSKESDEAPSIAENELAPNATTKVNPENQPKPRGKGKTSVNEFSRANNPSETIAADFDKLKLNGMEKDGAADFKNIKGVNTSDAAQIKEISSKMVDIIGAEIKELKEKSGLLSKGDTKRLQTLETARQKFSEPEKIKNLNLVNSSAQSFRPNDVKRTKVHEELHSMGYEDESQVREATQKIIDNKDYDVRKDKNSIDKLITVPKAREVDDIITDETKNESEPIELDNEGFKQAVDKFEGIVEKFTSNAKTQESISVADGLANGPSFAKLVGPIPLGYLLKQLTKAVKVNGESVSSVVGSMSGEKASTALEAKVVVEEAISKATDKNDAV